MTVLGRLGVDGDMRAGGSTELNTFGGNTRVVGNLTVEGVINPDGSVAVQDPCCTVSESGDVIFDRLTTFKQPATFEGMACLFHSQRACHSDRM